jgi:hypothetical protein
MDYEEWFEFDYDKAEYFPKDGAPQEALRLYDDYMKTQKYLKEKGYKA